MLDGRHLLSDTRTAQGHEELVRRVAEHLGVTTTHADLERPSRAPAMPPEGVVSAVFAIFERRLAGGSDLFGRDELVRAIADQLATDEENARRITFEVLRATKRVLPPADVAELEARLPRDLFMLWRAAIPSSDHFEASPRPARRAPATAPVPVPPVQERFFLWTLIAVFACALLALLTAGWRVTRGPLSR